MKHVAAITAIAAALAISIAAFAQTPAAPGTAAPSSQAVPTLGLSTPIADVTPIYAGKAPNQRVTPEHWPCEKGQLKGNLKSMIVHGPTQRDYSKTHKNVQCFDLLKEATDAGFRPAKR